MRWRYWLTEAPEHVTKIALMWYRLYFVVVVIVAAVIPTALALIAFGLFLVGIRWGW